AGEVAGPNERTLGQPLVLTAGRGLLGGRQLGRRDRVGTGLVLARFVDPEQLVALAEYGVARTHRSVLSWVVPSEVRTSPSVCSSRAIAASAWARTRSSSS